MIHMLNKTNHLIDLIIDIMAVIGRLLLVAITILVFVDIITLKLFDYSLSWIFEVNEYSLLFITFLGAAFVLRRDEHIKLDLVLNLLSNKQRRIVEIVNSFIGMIISLIVTVAGFIATMSLYERNIISEGVISIPRYLIVIIIPIGLLFITIQFFRIMMQRLKNTA